jgi:hypothetical protein
MRAAVPFVGACAGVVLAACATPPPPVERRAEGEPERSVTWRQAHEPVPEVYVLEEADARAAYREAALLELRAKWAEDAGDSQAARDGLARAADAYAAFARDFPRTGWALPVRRHAATLYARAERHREAIALAEPLAKDPGVDPRSRALAWLVVANARAGAGELASLRLPPALRRSGPAREARPPPGAWGEVVRAVREHLADLAAAANGLDLRPSSTSDAGLALEAARVELAFGRVREARALLGTIVERWPADAAALEAAAPLYLESFPPGREGAAYRAALARVRRAAEERARAAPRSARAAYARILDRLESLDASRRFAEARRLLDEERPAKAAVLFEELGRRRWAHAPYALQAAAIAWDRAIEPARASAARERILAEYPGSEVAPNAALALAERRTSAGDHAEAARLYAEHATRWPDDVNRCIALRNGAIAVDRARRPAAAAEAYLAFGADTRCAKETPDAAARALYRAGALFSRENRRRDASAAFRAALAVSGVTDPGAKRLLAEARSRIGG